MGIRMQVVFWLAELEDRSRATAQLIVRAVVAGDRDPRKLAGVCHPRIQASRGEIPKSQEDKHRCDDLIAYPSPLFEREGWPACWSDDAPAHLCSPSRQVLVCAVAVSALDRFAQAKLLLALPNSV